jgi:hypothetical protein
MRSCAWRVRRMPAIAVPSGSSRRHFSSVGDDENLSQSALYGLVPQNACSWERMRGRRLSPSPGPPTRAGWARSDRSELAFVTAAIARSGTPIRFEAGLPGNWRSSPEHGVVRNASLRGGGPSRPRTALWCRGEILRSCVADASATEERRLVVDSAMGRNRLRRRSKHRRRCRSSATGCGSRWAVRGSGVPEEHLLFLRNAG